MRPQQRWLEEEGIIYTGFWEPIHFYRQMGNASQNTASVCDYIKSEAHLKHLAALGVNHLWCNFSKGYGLQFEQAEQLKIRAMNKIAKQLKMRVIAYCTGGSLTPETVKYEAPDIDDWIAHPKPGEWASYGNNGYQNFRARPCYTSRGYIEWQKKVVTRALEYGCDGIHFDNTNINAEPGTCHCPRCLKLFREFLAEKYDRKDPAKRAVGIDRWGRDVFDFAREPWFDQWNVPVYQREISVANQQDWLLFREHIFQKALLEWADHIHKLGGAVEYNTGKSFHSAYRLWGGINDEVLYPHTDIVFNEGALELGYNVHGSPHCRLREHKIVQNFDLPMMNYNRDTHMMAEAFSFNPGMLGMWDYHQNPADHAARIKFFHWYKNYIPYQTRQVSLAETAVLLHNESMTFSQIRVYQYLCSLTQLLQEEAIPYNFVYSKDLGDLSRYKLLLIPDMHCLKDAEAAQIAAWVKKGGSLFTTGRTGQRTDGFLRRTRVKAIHSQADLYATSEPENIFTNLTGENFTNDFVKSVGKGRIGHMVKLEFISQPDLSTTATWMVDDEHINRPKNSDAVLKMLKQLLPERNLTVRSGQDLVVDLCRRTDTGEGLVHLFNVSFAKEKKASATASFVWKEPVKSLTWIGYDRKETKVPFKSVGGRVQFKLTGIRESAVIVINKK
ncbi:MAG TPA: alpha-amylase family protein [Planctomycetota bacterium]|nr:alpha-amylase family protein [Planctomycetota bacterium]